MYESKTPLERIDIVPIERLRKINRMVFDSTVRTRYQSDPRK